MPDDRKQEVKQLDSFLRAYLRQIKTQKKRRYRLSAVIAALSVAVSGSVAWQLRGIGTAMTDGEQTDEIIQDLIAEAQAADPLLLDASLSDLENKSLAERVACIAESQLGYTERTQNDILDTDGETLCRYSYYGAWYGNPFGEWNTAFTCFCLSQGCAEEAGIPMQAGCWAWTLELEKQGLLTPAEKASPQRGDVVFLDSDLDGKADRSAIIRDTADDGGLLNVIEGNTEGRVAETEYRTDAECIAGYLSFESIETAEPPPGRAPDLREFSGISESGITVAVSADQNAFPENAVMTVCDVPDSDTFIDAGTQDAVAVDISFTDADGAELEPAEDSEIHVQISLPDTLTLPCGEYALLHVTDSGDVKPVADAAVTETGAEFEAESFSIYVLVSGSYTDKDQAITVNGQAIPNSEDMPYVVYVGDSFTIKTVAENWTHPEWGGQGYPYGADASILEKISQTSVDSENQNGALVVLETTYQAKSAGSTVIHLTEDRNFKSSDFYVRVFEKPEIYVRTEYEDKPIDRVKEYLGGYNLYNQDGYVPNGKGKEDWGAWPRPYVMRKGDEAVIYITGISSFETSQYNLSFDGNWNYILTTPTDSKIEVTPVNIGESGVTALKIKGLNAGEAEIRFPEYNKSMWVRVMPDDEKYTHADMEIADGGKYTITEITYDEQGNKITTVQVFNALVNYVNYANVYGSGTEPLSTFRSDENPDQSDYEIIGEEGGTQYELTSAFKCMWKGSKHYKLNEVTHVLFDVNIEMRPIAEYTIDQNNQVSVKKQYSKEESIANRSFINGIQYDLGKQAIIDAMNKCPMSNGLDFTVKANAAVIKLKAVKELNGGILQEGQFSFELVDDAGNVVSSAVNDKDGNVVFLDQIYTEPGTYTYTIREKETGNPSKLVYDSPKNVTVTISEVCVSDDITILSASISEMPKFINYVTYRLPNTGGTGTLPYTVIGIMMIAGAGVLAHKKRRKERM